MTKEEAFDSWYNYNYSWFLNQFPEKQLDHEIKSRILDMKAHDKRVWSAAVEWCNEHRDEIDDY